MSSIKKVKEGWKSKVACDQAVKGSNEGDEPPGYIHPKIKVNGEIYFFC